LSDELVELNVTAAELARELHIPEANSFLKYNKIWLFTGNTNDDSGDCQNYPLGIGQIG